jgi:ABC-type multidrug transport system ATPase subunit
MTDTIIKITDLCKSFRGFQAVDRLNFEVKRGDVYGFLGPNGAGKSTTIRMLLMLISPDSGEISIFGKPLHQNRNAILARTGSIVEKPDFYKYLTAEKNIMLMARLSGIHPTKKRMEEIFELVGLKGREKDPAKNYSHGMKQRLGLAQALIHDPDLIILDEPTTGLDPQGIIDIRNLIRHLSADLKKTVILSSHILSEIEMIASRMVIINKGKAIAEGSVEELLNTSDRIVSFTMDNAEDGKKAVDESAWKNSLREINAGSLVFHIHTNEIVLLNKYFVERGIGITGIESRKKLEDYFLQLVHNN